MSDRKHSSGDLHSRLKTRKILGVGQTDGGDVHRSKISQLLGHNEHLYVRFPRGYHVWYIFLATFLSMAGAMNLLAPRSWVALVTIPVTDQTCDGQHLLTRFYGSSLIGLGAIFWSFYDTNDRSVARSFMLVSFLLHASKLYITASNVGLFWHNNKLQFIVSTLVETVICLISYWFYRSIGSSTSGIRRSNSIKELNDIN